MQGLGDTSAFETFDRVSDQINLLEAEAEAGAELAGEISGSTLESKFLALESGGHGSEEDALNELKAKMGMLGGSTLETKQLRAGQDSAGSARPADAESDGASLSDEDLKELEDLDLSGADMDELKAELADLEKQMAEEAEGDSADAADDAKEKSAKAK